MLEFIEEIIATTWRIIRTPVIFIQWRQWQHSFRGGLLDVPFTEYWNWN